MTKISSLKDYLETSNGPSSFTPTIGKCGSELEEVIDATYQTLQPELAKNASINYLLPYVEAGDIPQGLAKEWKKAVVEFGKQPARKNKLQYGIGYVMDGGGAIALLGGFLGTIGSIWAAIGYHDPSLLYQVTLPVAGVGIASLFVGVAGSELVKSSLKQYRKGSAQDYVLFVRDLHLLAQKMEREVADITTLEQAQAEKMFTQYGLERLRQNGTDVRALREQYADNKAGYDAVVRNEGKIALTEKMAEAKTQVERIKTYTATVLEATQTLPNLLTDKYVPHGERDRQPAAESQPNVQPDPELQEVDAILEQDGATLDARIKIARARRTEAQRG